MIKIIFLGTASMMPTKERNAISTLLNYQGEYILIDCGENTQRQLRYINIDPVRITKILLTHIHGDHTLGLPGLLQTIASANTQKTVEIYGPRNTKNFMSALTTLFLKKGENQKLSIMEIGEGIFFENKDFTLAAAKLEHTTHCLGYSFQEKDKRRINLQYTKKFGLTKHPLLGKLQQGLTITFKGQKISPKKATIIKKGKKIVFILDTMYTEKAIKLAKDADLLITEATFLENLKEKAYSYKHLTAREAAIIAKRAKAKRLILTHFSKRYANVADLEKEARRIFKNTEAAKDFLEVI